MASLHSIIAMLITVAAMTLPVGDDRVKAISMPVLINFMVFVSKSTRCYKAGK